jgi:hypothetical protein
MAANTNLRAELNPEGRPLRQVIAICAKHGVAYGSPDDLPGFMTALSENKHLAMDFWSMIARINDCSETTDPRWLLRIIVEGVTGQSLADLDAADVHQKAPLQKLASMLAGEDIQTPVDRKPVSSSHEAFGGSVLFRSPWPDPPAFMPPLPILANPTPASPAPFPAPYLISPDATGRRLTLAPDPIGAAPDSNPENPPTEPHWVIPLEAYAESNHATFVSRRLAVGALVATLLIGSALLLFQNGKRLAEALSAGYSSAIATWSQPQSPRQSTAPGTTANTTSLPTPISQQPERTFATVQPASTHADHGPPSTTDTASSATPRDGGARIVVPEILMNQNLISSRAPTDAPRVHGTHAQGPVVIQAIVSKHGAVEHLHVVSGDSALRRAAIETALSRRYQPYLLNGTPVDVSTTISVDFSSSH